MEALLSRLVPTDADPGAVELGAAEFIEDRLSEDPALAPIYIRGLEELAQRGFANLDTSRQDDLLKVADSKFMHLAATHAIEAVYTHPAGLSLVGFEVTL